MQRVVKCDKCNKDFIQKYVSANKSWSKLNEVEYWTSGKHWNNYKLFCRSCLNKWFEFEREIFNKLVDDPKKRIMFYSYRGHGSLNKKDHLTEK